MAETRKRKLNDIVDSGQDDSTQTKKSTCSSLNSEQKRTIGPSLRPPNDSGINATHGNGDPDSDSDSDDIGPLNANQSSGDPNSDADSDSDDIGPVLPAAGTEHSRLDRNTDFGNLEIPEEKHTHAVKSQRDEWMLQPPDKSDWTSRVDPTKLRNRTFQTGRSARAPSVADRADTSWVESQEQKIERKRDEVLGVSAPTPGGKESYCTEAPKMTEAFQERIQKFSEATRKDISQKSKSRSRDDDDDPSGRPFDRERDIATSKISNGQRREMLNRAAEFGSRFTGGRLL